MVIGGGPAGMEVARIAKLRGHQVTLVEKDKKLGGQLRLAALPPGKEKISWYSDYLIGQMKKLRIKIRVNQEVTLAYVQKVKPQVVIVATGATPWIPDIPGVQNPNVIRAWDVLGGKKKVADSTVLVAGGGTVGCETALFLASQNRKIVIVEMLESIALDLEPINRLDLQTKVKQMGIEVLVKKTIKRITEEGIIIADENGKEELIRAEKIILALGVRPDNSLSRRLKGRVPELHVIGDSCEPGKIIEAVYDGSRIGRVI